jgi:acyl-coenzyme A thioesterase PaaI-like protein
MSNISAMTTTDEIATGMLAAVPFARTLGVEFVEGGSDTVVARLPDNPGVHNHVGGPHAGALFSLGETASGAMVLATFAEQLTRAVPLAVRADIAYRKLAMGTVLARARLGRPAAEVVGELDAGHRPEFDVLVEIGTEDGTVTAEMTVVWTLRPR